MTCSKQSSVQSDGNYTIYIVLVLMDLSEKVFKVHLWLFHWCYITKGKDWIVYFHNPMQTLYSFFLTSIKKKNTDNEKGNSFNFCNLE